MLFKLFS